jgi:hypothetical protein
MLVVFFLMLVGTFYSKKEIEEHGAFLEKESGWRTAFMIFIAVGIVFIFMDALTVESGQTWLEVFMYWLARFNTDTTVAAILLIIFVIGVIYFIGRAETEPKSK